MKQRFLVPLVAAALVSLFAGGCAKRVNFDTWRAGVEQYVREKGGGDPTVLRDLQATPSHRGFRLFSNQRPSESKDAVGVLVGNASVAQRPWMVFLVGVVDEQQAEDVRVAALSVQDGRYSWRVGQEDEEATETYVNYNKGLANRRFPNRRDEPPEYLGFPREEDRFDLSTDGNSIGVAHPPSGAKWHVNVAPESASR